MSKEQSPPSASLLKLNLGCGNQKIKGYINIDCEQSCKPDLVHNFIDKPLPYGDGTVDEIAFFHTIEHIRKVFHLQILRDFWRVLRPGGELTISFPEFERCVENWKKNRMGKRDFWEATIFGRQLYPSDHHVCIMETKEFSNLLMQCGFENIFACPESGEAYNTVVNCTKGKPVKMYEDVIREDMDRTKFKKVKL